MHSAGAADALADRRSDNAQAAAEIATTSRQIAEQQELLEGSRDQERKLVEEPPGLGVFLAKMWEEAPFEPLASDLMLEWLTCRSEIFEAVERRATSERQLAALRREEAEAKASARRMIAGSPGTIRC